MGNFISGRRDAADAEGERDTNTDDVKGLDAENELAAAPRTVQRRRTPAPRRKIAASSPAAAPSGVNKKSRHNFSKPTAAPRWKVAESLPASAAPSNANKRSRHNFSKPADAYHQKVAASSPAAAAAPPSNVYKRSRHNFSKPTDARAPGSTSRKSSYQKPAPRKCPPFASAVSAADDNDSNYSDAESNSSDDDSSYSDANNESKQDDVAVEAAISESSSLFNGAATTATTTAVRRGHSFTTKSNSNELLRITYSTRRHTTTPTKARRWLYL